MLNHAVMIDAVFAGWPEEAEAVGEPTVRDLLTGEHPLDAEHEGQRFDLKSVLELLAAAAGFVAAAWEIIDRLRGTRQTLTAADVLEALGSNVPPSLDDAAKRAAIVLLLRDLHR